MSSPSPGADRASDEQRRESGGVALKIPPPPQRRCAGIPGRSRCVRVVGILFIGAAVPIVRAVVLSRATLHPTRRKRLHPGKSACAPGGPLKREAAALLLFLSQSGDLGYP